MPSINLIASHREEKRRFEQHVRRLAYAVAAEVGVILLVTSVLELRLTTVKGQIQQLDGQIAKLEPKVNDIVKLQADTVALQPEVTTLDEARNNTLYWYTALQSVVSCLPQKAWLTSINTSGDPTPPPTASTSASASSDAKPAVAAPATTPPTLSVAGMAADSNDVGTAMVKMNQYANIASVTLGSLQQSGAPNTQAMSMMFNLTINLKPNTAQDVTTPGFPAATSLSSASGAQPAKVASIDTGNPTKAQGSSHV